MTLLVVDADQPTIVEALPQDAVTVAPDNALEAVASDDHEVVVATDAVETPADVVGAIRGTVPDITVVEVADGAANADGMVDAAASSPDREEIRAEIECARRVSAYLDSVSALYTACRERALGGDQDVRARRREADARFDELPEDGTAFAAVMDSLDGATGEDDTSGQRDEDG